MFFNFSKMNFNNQFSSHINPSHINYRFHQNANYTNQSFTNQLHSNPNYANQTFAYQFNSNPNYANQMITNQCMSQFPQNQYPYQPPLTNHNNFNQQPLTIIATKDTKDTGHVTSHRIQSILTSLIHGMNFVQRMPL